VELLMEVIVALLGIPVPATTIPATKLLVLAQVIVALPLVVAQPVRLTLGLTTAMPAVRPAVLAQVTVGLAVVSEQPLRFTVSDAAASLTRVFQVVPPSGESCMVQPLLPIKFCVSA
jgi:hypothetical protein